MRHRSEPNLGSRVNAINTREIPVTRNLNLSFPSVIFCNFLASGVVVLGYFSGAQFVENNFYIGGGDAILLGARPGAVIAYGLLLQLMLDFFRSSCGQIVNNRLKKFSNWISHCCVFRNQNSNMGYELLSEPEQDHARASLMVRAQWNFSKVDTVKTGLFRATHYVAAILVGVGTIGLPIYFMYHGDDITSKPIEIECSLYTIAGFLTQLGVFAAAARSDNPTGVLEEEIADEEEQVTNSPANSYS